MATPPTV